jgi:hypothetical protein
MGGKTGLDLVDTGGFGDIGADQDDPLLVYLELLDPLEFHVTALGGLVDDVIADKAATPSTATVGPRISGHYDIVTYWWTIPEVDACGNRHDTHYKLSVDEPGPALGTARPGSTMTRRRRRRSSPSNRTTDRSPAAPRSRSAARDSATPAR